MKKARVLLVDDNESQRRVIEFWLKEEQSCGSLILSKNLHHLFNDWALALATHNAGENTVRAAILKGKSRDFWKLRQQGLLPEETLEYVPKVVAAARGLSLFACRSFQPERQLVDHLAQRVEVTGEVFQKGGLTGIFVESVRELPKTR